MRTIAAIAIFCTGCATTADPNYMAQLDSYRQTIASQQSVELARARAEEARYIAMAQIAERSDAQTKSMALFALALSGRGDASARPVEVVLPRIPETAEDRALKWASIIFPTVTNVALAGFSYSLSKTQSNNNREVVLGSYGAITQFKPQPIDFSKLPATSVTTINNTTNAEVGNRDGLVVVGAQPNATQDNSPVTIVPPVFAPVVVVPTTGAPVFGPN